MKLLQISNEIKRTAPVFIVGEGRSGSSLLYRTLELHSSFRPRKVWHIEAKIFQHTNLTHRLTPDTNNSLYKYMLLDEEYFSEFLKQIRMIRILHQYTSNRYARILSQKYRVFWIVWLNHLVLRTYFYYAQQARQCHRIVEKTPFNTPHIDKLNWAFPNCKLLYIYRHSVDVLSSYRKVYRQEREAGWANISVDAFCAMYQRRIAAIMEAHSKRPDDLMLVRYETFVENPAEEFRKICSFLGEPFESEPVSITENPDYTSRREKHITGNIKTKTKDWGDYISVTEARDIENALAVTMRTLNYEKYTSL
jgi:hypothetical protein